MTLDTEEKKDDTVSSKDRAMAAFSKGSLYNTTNQYGVTKPFIPIPAVAAVSSSFDNPAVLGTTRQAVPDFWVYDGAKPTIGHQGKVATSREQLLPDKRITEQQAIEYQRVGSKKGWMFNGHPQQEGPGASGENTPTFTSDGFPNRIKETRWFPTPRSEEKQGLATHEFPAIDIKNNARGIGVTGSNSGNGGMQGGYQEVQQSRLNRLPIPMAKYNWTGSRLAGTGREDQGAQGGSGAGGYRAGYASAYPMRPSFREKTSNGMTRV